MNPKVGSLWRAFLFLFKYWSMPRLITTSHHCATWRDLMGEWDKRKGWEKEEKKREDRRCLLFSFFFFLFFFVMWYSCFRVELGIEAKGILGIYGHCHGNSYQMVLLQEVKAISDTKTFLQSLLHTISIFSSFEYFVPLSKKDWIMQNFVFLLLELHVVCELYLRYSKLLG